MGPVHGPAQAVYKVGLQVCFPMEVGDPLLQRFGNVIGDQYPKVACRNLSSVHQMLEVRSP